MLETLLHTSTMPILTAFLLGLMTIISPCPFCSNLTAIGYISKDISSRHRILLSGIMYAVGKIFAYTLLSLIFIFGAQIEGIQHFLQTYGEPALGPFLFLCGLFMLIGGHHEQHHDHEHNHGLRARLSRFTRTSNLNSLLLGFIFSLAFCPYSGVMYFGMLIPMTIAEPLAWSWLMPVVYGLGTGLPVIIIAWLLAYSALGIGKINHNIQHIEIWLRRICATLFIGIGLYLTISIFGGHHHHDHDHDCEHHHTQSSTIHPRVETPLMRVSHDMTNCHKKVLFAYATSVEHSSKNRDTSTEGLNPQRATLENSIL